MSAVNRTVMIGGEYGKVSSLQRVVIENVLPHIAAAMQRTNSRAVVLGDYGVADGLTSKAWVEAALAETSAPLVTVVHVDLPCNNWAAFLENTADLTRPNLLTLLSPVSFYRRAVQPSSIALGVAAYSFHWTQSIHPVPGFLFGQAAPDSAAKQRWCEASSADFTLLIRQRITEMEPGATFIITQPYTLHGTHTEAIVTVMEAAHAALYERGILTGDVQLSIPEHFRTPEEILAVLTTFSDEITDIRCDAVVKPNPAWEAAQCSPDPRAALAAQSAAFNRVIHHSILAQQLEAKLGGDTAAAVLSAYWADVEQRILQDTQAWERFAFTVATFKKKPAPA